jgi:hypothetical protein
MQETLLPLVADRYDQPLKEVTQVCLSWVLRQTCAQPFFHLCSSFDSIPLYMNNDLFINEEELTSLTATEDECDIKLISPILCGNDVFNKTENLCSHKASDNAINCN